MATFYEVINKNLSPYYFYIFVFVIFVTFGAIAYYYLNSKVKDSQNKFKDVANASDQDVATIFMFHVDWCPHCKKAMPEWQSFVNSYDGKDVNGYVIKCVDMDCTEETSEVASTLKKYNIESYPTVKMLRGNEVIEFDSVIKETTLTQFVETMLNRDD
jgi:thiol-disulfide isomerase/thioredoxin